MKAGKFGLLSASGYVEDARRSTFVDLSHWQGGVDFDKMFSPLQDPQVEAVIVKATEGWSYRDPMFETNASQLAASGKPWGAYHFWWPTLGPASQAANFFETVNPYAPSMYPVIDVEKAPPADWSNIKVAAVLRDFLESIILQFDEYPIVYTGAWWWDRYIGDVAPSWQSRYDYWLAHYLLIPNTSTGLPRLPRSFDGYDNVAAWQYTSNGDGKKYGAQSSGLDMNVTLVDLSDLLVDAPSPPPPPVGLEERVEILEQEVEDLAGALVSAATDLEGTKLRLNQTKSDLAATGLVVQDHADRIAVLEEGGGTQHGPNGSLWATVVNDKAAWFTFKDYNANGLPIISERYQPLTATELGNRLLVYNVQIRSGDGRWFYQAYVPGSEPGKINKGDPFVRVDRVLIGG